MKHLAYPVLILMLFPLTVRGAEPVDDNLGILACTEAATSAGCKLAWNPGAAPRRVYALQRLAARGQGLSPGHIAPDPTGRLPPAADYRWRTLDVAADGSPWTPRMHQPGLYRVLGCERFDKRAGGTDCVSSLSFWLPEKPPIAAVPDQVALADENGAWSYAAVNRDTPPEAMYSQYNVYLAANVVVHARDIDVLPPMYPPHGNADFLYASDLDHIIHHNVARNFNELIEYLRGNAIAK